MNNAALTAALQHADHWCIVQNTPGAVAVFRPLYKSNKHHSPELFTRQDFDMVDTRLHSILVDRLSGQTLLQGTVLRTSLDFWAGNHVLLPSPSAVDEPAFFAVKEFVTLKPTNEPGLVMVNCRVYSTDVTVDQVEYSNNVHAVRTVQSTAVLDSLFPGWLGRYQVGIALDLNSTELTQYALRSAAVPARPGPVVQLSGF